VSAVLRDFGFRHHRATRFEHAKMRARKIEFREQSQRATQCPVLAGKNISLSFGLPAAHFCAVHSTKGRIAIVTDAELDAMDTRDIADEGYRRGRSSRVVLIPRRWDQAAQKICAAMVAKKPGTPGRARNSRKTIAQGMPDCFRRPVVTTARALSAFLRARLRVRLSIRHSLLPPLRGTLMMQNSGKACRGNANLWLLPYRAPSFETALRASSG
jgi:hypothetical protein